MRIEKAPVVLAALAALTLSTVCRTASPAPHQIHRAILISFDGLSADEVEQRTQSQFFDSSTFVARMLKEDHYRRVVPINPPLTAAAHAAIATGTTADHNGIISNWFHPAGTAIDKAVRGLDADNQADTLWEAAERSGLRVGVITFPGVDDRNQHRRGDWGLVYVTPAVPARIEHLHRSDFAPASDLAVQSFSPLLEAHRIWATAKNEATTEVSLVAVDSTDDGEVNYDSIEVFVDGRRVDQERWFPVSAVAGANESLYGSWSKVLSFDSALAGVAIYWGPISANRGYPDSYRRMIDREAGFWPGQPDPSLAMKWFGGHGGHDGLDPESFAEQSKRLSDFFSRAAKVSMAQMPFDLLLAYDPIIDDAQHHYLLVNSAQKGWSADNARRSRGVRDSAYRAFSDAADQLANGAAPDVALFITGDHGIAPCETSVSLSQILSDWGYLQLAGSRTAPTSRWALVPSENYALLYRSPAVPEAEVEELAARLAGLKAPDGTAVFERVELKSDHSNPNEGDIIATAFPRFTVDAAPSKELFAPSAVVGQHGGLNSHKELNTVLIGPDVPPSATSPLPQTSIARIISDILGIAPPRDAQ